MIFEDESWYDKISAEKLLSRLEALGELAQAVDAPERGKVDEFFIKADTFNEIFQVYNKLVDDVSKLEYEIFLKHYQNPLTSNQKKFYKNLHKTEAKQVLVDRFAPDTTLEPETKFLKDNFQPDIREVALVKELSEELYRNDYIDQPSTDIFEKMFRLEAVSPTDRIIWIKQRNKRITVKPLVELLYDKIIHTRANPNVGMIHLICSYFKMYNGEFNRASLNVIVSKVANLDEEDRDPMIQNFRAMYL